MAKKERVILSMKGSLMSILFCVLIQDQYKAKWKENTASNKSQDQLSRVTKC